MDTAIRLNYKGIDIDTPLTVRTPKYTQLVSGPDDAAVGLNGYSTIYRFKVLDYFREALPAEIEVNEWFGTWYSDWTIAAGNPTDENWSEPLPNGRFTGSEVPLQFKDTYAYSSAPWITPGTVDPGSPLADKKVQHAVQGYYAGSVTPGEGLAIKAHVLQLYRGKGRQE